MGVFDTFYGRIKCEHCGKEHTFTEDTKAYNCIFDNYTLGDYIDGDNDTYVYSFETFCDESFEENKDVKKFIGNIIIVKGQIVKFVNNKELKNINIKKLKNIEEGLGRKLEYIKACKDGIGYAKETINISEHPKKNGDRLISLGHNWLIKETFTEKLVTKEYDKCYSMYKFWYKDSFVYKVENHLGSRIIRVTKDDMEVFYDNGDYSGYNHDRPNDFFIQYGCVLEKII